MDQNLINVLTARNQILELNFQIIVHVFRVLIRISFLIFIKKLIYQLILGYFEDNV
jgi:hypothetical protein